MAGSTAYTSTCAPASDWFSAPIARPSSTTLASRAISGLRGASPVRNCQVAAKAAGENEVSRWSTRGSTMLVAPLSAGPSKPMFVGLPGEPTHRPSGWANLSLLSERSVSHFTPGVTSSPFGPLGALSCRMKGDSPENSLFSRRPGTAQMPCAGLPPSTTWLVTAAPPPFCT